MEYKVFYQFDMLQCYEKINNGSISSETESELEVLNLNRLDYPEATFRPLTILNFSYSNQSMILFAEHSQSNSMNMYSIIHIFSLDRVRLRQCSLPIARISTPRMSSSTTPPHAQNYETTLTLMVTLSTRVVKSHYNCGGAHTATLLYGLEHLSED